jgi:hypothetical protein
VEDHGEGGRGGATGEEPPGGSGGHVGKTLAGRTEIVGNGFKNEVCGGTTHEEGFRGGGGGGDGNLGGGAGSLEVTFSPMRTTPCRRYGWSGVEARGSTAVGGSEEHGGGGEAGHGWVFAAAGG